MFFKFFKKTILKKNFFFKTMTTTILLKTYIDQKKYLNCNERNLIKIKNEINKEITQLKYTYGEQTNYFPEPIIKKIENKYILEFLIDHRICDIFIILHDIIDFLNNKEIKIKPFLKDLRSFKHDNLKTIQIDFEEKGFKGTISITGEYILDRPGFKFTLEKENALSKKDIQIFINAYKQTYKPSIIKDIHKNYINSLTNISDQKKNKSSNSKKNKQKILEDLKKLGVLIFLPDTNKNTKKKTWQDLGGYESQKRAIEDTILLSLTHPKIYDSITKKTRQKFSPNRPKAVLFEGPPGTGKTTSAKIIANQVGIPLIYIPIEVVLSKWYGEAEKNLSLIFEKSAGLGKSIIFIDEIDALAISRSERNTHEVSKRLVSVLLRKLDSFESDHEILLICATNRKSLLDPAILSRLDLSIYFGLPDFRARIEIFRKYAKQLSTQELEVLAGNSKDLSGRGILEVCKDVERKWASKVIRKEEEGFEPNLDVYLESLKERISSMLE